MKYVWEHSALARDHPPLTHGVTVPLVEALWMVAPSAGNTGPGSSSMSPVRSASGRRESMPKVEPPGPPRPTRSQEIQPPERLDSHHVRPFDSRMIPV